MDWSTEDNAKGLVAFDVPINVETLYGAHKFGLENYVEIYSADGEKKLSKVIGEEANSPVFKNFKNVSSVKAFITRKLKKPTEEFDKN